MFFPNGIDWRRRGRAAVAPSRGETKVKVRVDLELCLRHGRCYMLAPEVFGEDERGRCRIADENVPAGLEERARVGAANCPEGAIEIEEE
jgi:ferredoxin